MKTIVTIREITMTLDIIRVIKLIKMDTGK